MQILLGIVTFATCWYTYSFHTAQWVKGIGTNAAIHLSENAQAHRRLAKEWADRTFQLKANGLLTKIHEFEATEHLRTSDLRAMGSGPLG